MSNEVRERVDATVLREMGALRRRNDELNAAFGEVQAAQAELQRQLALYTEPPWRRATFLRRFETPAGALADVLLADGDGRRLLLRPGADFDLDGCALGQSVYINHQGTLVLAPCEDEPPPTGEVASVERTLEDGRLLLRRGEEAIVVEPNEELARVAVQPGDRVLWQPHARLACERVDRAVRTDVFVTEYVSAQPARRLGGLDREVAEVVSLFSQGVARPEMAARYGLVGGCSLLLHGPPGNGKTSLARIACSAVAEATGQRCRFACVKGAQLESPYVGSSEQNVRDLFVEMHCADGAAILLLDEADAIGRHRGGPGAQHGDKFLSTWLTEIEGLVARGGMIGIIATTNRKDLIDQALLERLSAVELFIGRPDLESAREIFAIHLPPDLPFGPAGAATDGARDRIIDTAVARLYSPNGDNLVAELGFRDGSRRRIAARELLSGRIIEQICLQARRSAFRRHADGGAPGIRPEDMEEAVARALERLGTTLSRANARALLPDLPQDLDVTSVDPAPRRLATHHYHCGADHG